MPYQYINQSDHLVQFCQSCSDSQWLAVDTEFLRQDTYFAKLSLIQIETDKGSAALIDPLQVDDLSPLWALFANPAICKVFHSARQDIEVLFLTSNIMPQNLFDTQLAAVFLGYGDLAGFARVVEGELGVTLNKAETRTNWHQRPLTQAQQDYAYDDVHYLAPLYQKIISQLSAEQIQYLSNDNQALLDQSLYQPNPEESGQKIKGGKGLSGKHLTVAYTLAQWREEYAIEHDVPKKWSLSDDVLTAIAKRPPKTKEALYKVPHIKSSSVKAFGETWIELIDHVFSNPESWHKKPKITPPPITEAEKDLLEACQLICKLIAKQTKINYANLANKTELLQIIQQASPVLSGWRHLIVEKPLRQFLSGKSSLTCHQNQLQFQKTN